MPGPFLKLKLIVTAKRPQIQSEVKKKMTKIVSKKIINFY